MVTSFQIGFDYEGAGLRLNVYVEVLLQCVCVCVCLCVIYSFLCRTENKASLHLQYSVFPAPVRYSKPIKPSHPIMALYCPFAAHFVKWRHIWKRGMLNETR